MPYCLLLIAILLFFAIGYEARRKHIRNKVRVAHCKDHPVMQQTTFQKTHVLVDKCSHCRSYWLDHDELYQILQQTR